MSGKTRNTLSDKLLDCKDSYEWEHIILWERVKELNCMFVREIDDNVWNILAIQ